jgi:hypothetical protein
MKFNISTEFSIVVFLFLTVMIISSCGSTRIRSYESKSSTLPMFPYKDGFSNYDSPTDKIIPEPTNIEPLTTVKQPIRNSVEPNDDSEKTDRMQKLQWGEYGIEHPIDIVSKLPSSPSCANISAGLSNSKGYICTTDEVQKMYKTRGGNASGQPSQIGA